jgi:hypothetical protein
MQIYWSGRYGNGHFTPFGSALGILLVIYAGLFAVSGSKSEPVQPSERSPVEPPEPQAKAQPTTDDEDPLTWNIGGPEGRQKVEAELNDIFWSLPREMALDEALRDIATKVMLGREHGARMAAIDILTRLELRSREQLELISARLKPLPHEGSAWPYEVLPGGDPELDFVIPPDEALLLHKRDLETKAIWAAKRASAESKREQRPTGTA